METWEQDKVDFTERSTITTATSPVMTTTSQGVGESRFHVSTKFPDTAVRNHFSVSLQQYHCCDLQERIQLEVTYLNSIKSSTENINTVNKQGGGVPPLKDSCGKTANFHT